MTKKLPTNATKKQIEDAHNERYANWLLHCAERAERMDLRIDRGETVIRTMSNWQMTQWHRAGRPKDKINQYAALKHGERP